MCIRDSCDPDGLQAGEGRGRSCSKGVTATDETKADRVETRRPSRITSFVRNQRNPDTKRRVFDWIRSRLHLLVVDTSGGCETRGRETID